MKNRICKLIPLAWFLIPIVLMIGAALATAPTAPPSMTQISEVADAPPVSMADTRPVGFILTHGAPRTAENPRGMRRNLIDANEGYRWLVDQLVTRPYDRFIIHLPAGGDGTRMGGAQWWTIDEAHLEMYTRAIRDAMRLRPGITVGIYGALSFSFTHSVRMTSPKWHRADFDSVHDRWAVWQQSVAPWVRAGVFEFWWDNASASDGRHDAILFHDWLRDTHAVRTGIEAFPTDRQADRSWALDRETMNKVPSLALFRFVRARDPNGTWDVNGLAYEAIVLVLPRRGEDPPTVGELSSLLKRGFVLAARDRLDDLVQEAHKAFSNGE